AVWEDQLNLADPAAVAKIADEAGLPGTKLVDRSGSDEVSAAYEQNRQDALAADVFGSPVYVLNDEVFWGQDRIELLADALKSGPGWAACAEPNERATFDTEIGRLQADNERLKAQLAERDGTVTGKVDEALPKTDPLKKPEPKVAEGERKIEIPLPSDRDMDR